MSGTVLITGATAGIGQAAAQQILDLLPATHGAPA